MLSNDIMAITPSWNPGAQSGERRTVSAKTVGEQVCMSWHMVHQGKRTVPTYFEWPRDMLSYDERSQVLRTLLRLVSVAYAQYDT